jgi:hypothetical protein
MHLINCGGFRHQQGSSCWRMTAKSPSLRSAFRRGRPPAIVGGASVCRLPEPQPGRGGTLRRGWRAPQGSRVPQANRFRKCRNRIVGSRRILGGKRWLGGKPVKVEVVGRCCGGYERPPLGTRHACHFLASPGRGTGPPLVGPNSCHLGVGLSQCSSCPTGPALRRKRNRHLKEESGICFAAGLRQAKKRQGDRLLVNTVSFRSSM